MPITVGIIGHRDAVIKKDHEKAFLDLLNSIYNKFPNSPITLFSQLAAGADMWAARLFVKHGDENNRDYRLFVPLPMPIEDYMKDFSPEERIEFEVLVQKSDRCFELDNSDNNLDLKYRNGGKFVADSTMILVALFDGKENNLTGGTADIVYYKKNGVFKNDLDKTLSSSTGIVVELWCSREKSSNAENISLQLANVYKNYIKGRVIEKTLKKVDFGNRIYSKLKTKIEANSNTLYPNEPTSKKQNFLKLSYGLWDSCAEYYQKKYFLNLKLLSVFGLLLLVFFEIYRKETTDEFYPLVIIALAIAIFVIYQKIRGKNEHLYYIENRILAESIRVQFFWNKAGIQEQVTKYILRIHKKEYNWINAILNAIQGLSYQPSTRDSIDFDGIEKYWITDQKEFFHSALLKLDKRRNFHRYLTGSLVGFSLLIFIAIFSIELTGDYRAIEPSLIMVISILIGCFILIKGYYEKRGFNQISNQYELMLNVFKATESKINLINKSDLPKDEKEKRIKNLFFLAGKEALVEKGNWYSIFKDKELELEGI
ncbi:hypothetical protein [Winogradskyella pelagia]|nr:hypothetical protein [Winogradskyella sp. DF17]